MTHHALPIMASGLMPKWLQAHYLLDQLGPYLLPVVALIIFAECGLLIGFFLPGDSVLFTLGLFITAGHVDEPLWLVCLILSACAVFGNVVGYGIGYWIGPALFNKPDSKLFKREYVDKTHGFFEKYGARAIVLARLVPVVRTFITAVAGVGRMDARRYFTYSLLGGVVWASGITVMGYFLGRIDVVQNNLELFLIAVVVLSLIPIVIEYLRHRGERKPAARAASSAAPESTPDTTAGTTAGTTSVLPPVND